MRWLVLIGVIFDVVGVCTVSSGFDTLTADVAGPDGGCRTGRAR
jgi:hypothetical protein